MSSIGNVVGAIPTIGIIVSFLQLSLASRSSQIDQIHTNEVIHDIHLASILF